MLAIAGGKGGCGKTTTTLGLARALAASGPRGSAPLAVDADCEMPDLHLRADAAPEPGLAAVADGTPPASAAHRTPVAPGAAVVPGVDTDARDLPRALPRLREWDGPVLVDCPAGAGRDAARPLRAADRTLLVTTPTVESLRDGVKTAAMARALDAAPVGVVVVERARNGTEPPADRVAALFECPVLARVPAVDEPPIRAESVRLAHRAVGKKVFERNV
ncbi:MAG: MinD/ParA family protein [Haloarculaceae archaeon]